MLKRVSCTAAISLGVLAAAIVLGADGAAFGTDDCLAAPNRAPAPGGHWFYHLDRASDRKCWYLAAPVAQPPLAQAPQSPEPAQAPAQPSFGSFFSSLSAGFTPPSNPPSIAGDGRVMQPAPADEPKTGEAEPGRPSHVALAAKPHRTVHPRPPAEHAEDRPAASLNQGDRDALFEEFLRWRERQ